MNAEIFTRRTWIEAPATAVFRWHAEPGALARLTPPWEKVEILEEGTLKDGAEVELRVRIGPLSLPWVARIEGVVPGQSFRDVQVRGPFARWEHTHQMESAGPGSCWLVDRVVYVPPFGMLGRWLGGRLVRSRLERMFTYRHGVTRAAFAGWRAIRWFVAAGVL